MENFPLTILLVVDVVLVSWLFRNPGTLMPAKSRCSELNLLLVLLAVELVDTDPPSIAAAVLILPVAEPPVVVADDAVVVGPKGTRVPSGVKRATGWPET